jgi:hypothetical protein
VADECAPGEGGWKFYRRRIDRDLSLNFSKAQGMVFLIHSFTPLDLQVIFGKPLSNMQVACWLKEEQTNENMKECSSCFNLRPFGHHENPRF